MEHKQQDKNIELKEVLAPFLRHWYIYIICIILALLAVKIYGRYIVPQYNTTATILIKNDQKNNATPNGALSALSEINGMRSDGIDNELLILRSKRMLQNTIEDLNLYTTYKRKGNVLTTEVYRKSLPIEITVFPKDSTTKFNLTTTLKFNDKNFSIGPKEQLKTYNYNQAVPFDFGYIKVNKRQRALTNYINEPFLINIADAKTITHRLKQNLTVERYQNYKSAISISIINENKDKAVDVINELIRAFNEEAIADKNIEAKKTSEFINERISIINRELGGVESDIENFKQRNEIIDPVGSATEGISEVKQLSKEILDLDTKLEFISMYKNQVKKSGLNDILPSNILSEDSEVSSYISEYNKIVTQRNIQKKDATEENPVIKAQTEQLEQLKSAILTTIQKQNLLLQKQKDLLNARLGKYKSAISSAPKQERVLRSINRQQAIKENLYLLLLQKREENAIALATSADKAKIVDAPESVGPINKDLSIHYLWAALLGLLFPIGIIYLYTLLNTKIETRKDLTKIIGNYPMLGELPLLKKEDADAIVSQDSSTLSEAFRIIRTNLQYLLGKVKKGQGKAILITSTIKGEGKTFVSINIAHILSQLKDKKTIIIGADIRNPQLQRYYGEIRKKIGLTEYLYDDSIHASDIILTSPADNKTSIILSGAIPPNPTELIMSRRLKELIDELRTEFDYIVVDTAPLLLVSDTFYVSNLVDLSVIVTRSKFTEKGLIEFPMNAIKDQRIKHAAFILNGVKVNGSGYGYLSGNYGYGYGYHNEKKKGIWDKIFSLFKK